MDVCLHEEDALMSTGDILPAHLMKQVLMSHEEEELDKLINTIKVTKAKQDVFRQTRLVSVDKYFPIPY